MSPCTTDALTQTLRIILFYYYLLLSCPLIPAVCRYDCVFDIMDDAGLAASLANITTVDGTTNVGPCTHALLRLADGNYTLTQVVSNTLTCDMC